MFYYYGRKKKIANKYPEPNHGVIIEPFGGSAAYSLNGDNWKREVIIIEKDPQVAEIWYWLINEATEQEIQAMPLLKEGEYTSNFLHILHSASKRAFDYKTIKVTKIIATNWNCNRDQIAKNLYKVKHWKILNGDYSLAPDINATWFIDPPYKGDAGTGYRFGSQLLDYDKLAKWSLSRKGQLIFCEGGEADYLPFRPLLEQSTISGKKNKELIYTRES